MEKQTMNPKTSSSSLDELIQNDTPLLIDFYADWCGPCKMMNPILKDLKKRMGDKLNIIKIDAEKNPAAAIKYQVRGVPSIILIKNGEILWQQAGVVQAAQLESIIKERVANYD